jgi:hypothetical protein
MAADDEDVPGYRSAIKDQLRRRMVDEKIKGPGEFRSAIKELIPGEFRSAIKDQLRTRMVDDTTIEGGLKFRSAIPAHLRARYLYTISTAPLLYPSPGLLAAFL